MARKLLDMKICKVMGDGGDWGTRERTSTRYKNMLHSLNSMVLAQEGAVRPME